MYSPLGLVEFGGAASLGVTCYLGHGLVRNAEVVSLFGHASSSCSPNWVNCVFGELRGMFECFVLAGRCARRAQRHWITW